MIGARIVVKTVYILFYCACIQIYTLGLSSFDGTPMVVFPREKGHRLHVGGPTSTKTAVYYLQVVQYFQNQEGIRKQRTYILVSPSPPLPPSQNRGTLQTGGNFPQPARPALKKDTYAELALNLEDTEKPSADVRRPRGAAGSSTEKDQT